MDLTYSDIIKDKEESISNSISKSISKSKYKEETNILSYYILKNVLLNNYQDFLLWCEKNNKGLFQFIKSETHLQLFYQFIERNYKSPSMLRMIKHAETTKNIDKNMRMTCLEI
jgi:hypothetical protein